MGSRDEEFQAFYEDNLGWLRRVALRLTGDRDGAEDLAQDALIKTYRAWRKIRDTERPDLYARRIMLNLHRSALRRARIEARHFLSQRAPVSLDDEDAALVWDEVRKLRLGQRQAIVLHYYEGLSQVEVAEVLDCPVGTVNSLVYRGLGALRARLAPELEPIPRGELS